MRRIVALQKGAVLPFSIFVMLVLSALPLRTCAQTPPRQTAVVASQDIAPKVDEYMNALVKAGWFNG
ncbi:MAG TPA: hypothetical protein VFU37_22035, partial [Pyrinomonadaceae bacterium]|nr:hypothetical protein [Pyrinomonadaceae bacterium]